MGEPVPAEDLERARGFSQRWALAWADDDSILADFLRQLAEVRASIGRSTMTWRARLGERVLAYFVDTATASAMTRGMDPSGLLVERLDRLRTRAPRFCPLCGAGLPTPPDEIVGNLFMVVCPDSCDTTNVVVPSEGHAG